MRISCFCGTDYESDEELAACPTCGAMAVVPKRLPPKVIKQMEAELKALIEEHNG